MSADPRVPVTQPPNTYNAHQLSALLDSAAGASPAHLLAVADFLTQMFQQNSVSYAFMGGFSLRLRGSTRDTFDVDVAVGCTMLRLIEVVSAQTNILRPLGPVSGVMRIFVKVSLPNQANPQEMYVETDLILRGSLGAPDHPETESETISVQTSAGPRQYVVLNLKSIMAAKLGALFGRSARNDLDDLFFLTLKFAEPIWQIRDQLSKEHRQVFINALHKTYPGSQNKGDLKKCQFVLGIAGPVN